MEETGIGQVMFYYHPVFKRLSKSILWENRQRAITLTFDDGPQSKATETALSVLSKYSIKGVFFMLGTSLKQNPMLAAEVVREGHLVGNHSSSHRILPLMHYNLMQKNIIECEYLIRDTLGIESVGFRPPYGLFDHRVISIVKSINKRIWMFSVDSGDYTNRIDNMLLDRISQRLKSNSIVLFHDNQACLPLRTKLLEDTIDYCLDKGYSFSTGDTV